MTATIILVDLAGYSDMQRQFEQALGVPAAVALDAQIRQFITTALGGSGTLLQGTGDGGLLQFSAPDAAIATAERLQQLAAAHNQGVTEALARRLFRIGIATGDVGINPETGALSGTTISRAARLEARADLGGILIDAASHAAATPALVAAYAGPEQVPGKRDEVFTAWRRRIDTSPPSGMTPAKPSRDDLLDQIAADFARLRPDMIDTLLVRLDLAADRWPPDLLTAERRKSAILKWAHEDGQIERLAARLRAMVGTPPA